MGAETIDLLVKTNNPADLDQIVQHWGAVVVGGDEPGGYLKVDGYYVVRCFVNPEFAKFAFYNEGYGIVVRQLEKPL